MSFAALQLQPVLFRAALYEHLLGDEQQRQTPPSIQHETGLLPSYRVSAAPTPEPAPTGRYASYPRPGASEALFDVAMSHPEHANDMSDHQGRVVLSNVLSSNEPEFGNFGEYRMRCIIYAAKDADASALMTHVAQLLRALRADAVPMPGQCFGNVLDINRSGPTYQSGSGLWQGSVDFKVRLLVSRSNKNATP